MTKSDIITQVNDSATELKLVSAALWAVLCYHTLHSGTYAVVNDIMTALIKIHKDLENVGQYK
jgi:hypothetical protein